MTPIRPPGGNPPSISLDAFRQGAERGESVYVTVEGQQYTVRDQGQMVSSSGGTRSVAWVQEDVDTTSLFVSALGQGFGPGVSRAVAEALGLQPAPGKPLASRIVHQALEMANTGQQALQGVDFLTRLHLSASTMGPQFLRVVAQMEIDPSRLSADARALIDKRMGEHFDAALRQGQSPVAPETAAKWLRAELTAVQAKLG